MLSFYLQLKAYGHTLPPLGWLFDLQVTLSHLLGLLCSSVLSTKQIWRALPGKKVTEEAKEEEKLVHSDIWKTLFRGGSMVSKLTRSLSGAYYVSAALAHNVVMKKKIKFFCFHFVRHLVLLNQSWLPFLRTW